jgi:hypothetical protein
MNWLVDGPAFRPAGSRAPRFGPTSGGVVTIASVDPRHGRAVEDVARPYRSADDLSRLIARLRGALSRTVHATAADHDVAKLVVDQLVETVGRVVSNGYPTGVAVAWAMQHGGSYPATTDPLHTSVGAAAICRWLRPISYQNVPDELLPVELRGGDAFVLRRVDGDLVLPASPPGIPAAA